MDEVAKRFAAEVENRVKLMLVHALLGVAGGALMLAFGTARTYEDLVGPWARMVLGLLSLVGGVLIFLGVLSERRSAWKVCSLGIALMWIWYVAMTLGFLGAIVADPPIPSWPWEPAAGASASRPYVPVVYMSMGLLAGIHLTTLFRVRRA